MHMQAHKSGTIDEFSQHYSAVLLDAQKQQQQDGANSSSSSSHGAVYVLRYMIAQYVQKVKINIY